MRTPLTSLGRALAALWAKLDNEPIVKRLGSLAGLVAVVQLLEALGVIDQGVSTAITAFLVALGVPVGAVVRSEVDGPQTAAAKATLIANDPLRDLIHRHDDATPKDA